MTEEEFHPEARESHYVQMVRIEDDEKAEEEDLTKDAEKFDVYGINMVEKPSQSQSQSTQVQPSPSCQKALQELENRLEVKR